MNKRIEDFARLQDIADLFNKGCFAPHDNDSDEIPSTTIFSRSLECDWTLVWKMNTKTGAGTWKVEEYFQ